MADSMNGMDSMEKNRKARAFREGFLAGLSILGGVALILLAIFFL